ncbi:hypothetical protein HPB51_015235 [Rhipicephalus microplus]|uniref:Uncharacterized protein n=1 Tax=Rhipicephalus microplus TaxID=6941 RepID=A0A9J6DNG5_RHIMP|nr:hypothetical protein HPB51_015235 [Rhipicephalus microplus]
MESTTRGLQISCDRSWPKFGDAVFHRPGDVRRDSEESEQHLQYMDEADIPKPKQKVATNYYDDYYYIHRGRMTRGIRSFAPILSEPIHGVHDVE